MSVLNLISYFFRINNDSDYFLLKTIMIVQSSHSISNMATAASFYSFFLILSWCADVSEREGGIQKRGEFLAVVLCVNVIIKLMKQICAYSVCTLLSTCGCCIFDS